MSLDLSDTATGLLLSLASGTHIKLKRTTGRTFNPIDGRYSGGTTEIINLTAAATQIPNNLIDGERVKVGDKQFICDKGTRPNFDDVVIIPDESGNDEEFRITQITPVNPSGQVQIYKVFCRG